MAKFFHGVKDGAFFYKNESDPIPRLLPDPPLSQKGNLNDCTALRRDEKRVNLYVIPHLMQNPVFFRLPKKLNI